MSDDTPSPAWKIPLPEFAPMFHTAVRSPDGDTWIQVSEWLIDKYPALGEATPGSPGRVINDGIGYVSTKWLRKHHPEDGELQGFLVRLVARMDERVAEEKAKRG